MRMSPDDLQKITQRKGYHLPAYSLPTGIRDPLPKQDAGVQPLGENQDEEGGSGRFRVRITRRGARLLDADNAAGACKYILDACRYAGLVPDDSPAAIELEVRQEVVPKADRGTLIEVVRLP